MNSSLAPLGPRTRNSLIIKLPAAGVNGRVVQAFLPLPSLSPLPWLLEPPPAVGAEEALDADCFDAGALMKEKSPVTTGDSTGDVTITGTLRATRGITITATPRAARFFRFELFFLAEAPIDNEKSTAIADIAMIDIRTDLTIVAFSLRPPVAV